MVRLLDCTLRDGGYINSWDFSDHQISSALDNLTRAGIDYVEIGYLTSILNDVKGSKYLDVKSASKRIPTKAGNCKYLLMADISQFDKNTLTRRDETTVDGVRVVFYKRQIDQVLSFCEQITEMGYDLFLQPMVTVDYSLEEFGMVIGDLCRKLNVHAVSVVDSFGCMTAKEIHRYVEILDNILADEVQIGFHGHNNMQLSLINALLFFGLHVNRDFIIDSSVNGMGRGAGNLHTELIANYYNVQYNSSYDLGCIFRVASEVTEPIFRKHQWGYSPYLMVTAMARAHPNFATYLLSSHDISISDFVDYVKLIPPEMLSKCTRTYVEELYLKYTQQVKRGEAEK